MFHINEQSKALELYKEVIKNKYFVDTDKVIKIFYLKSEPEFEKYADEEAEIYHKEQEEIREK